MNIRCKRQGFGAPALAKARETARMQGFECLRLFVAGSNIPAIQFYKKAGLLEQRATMTKYSRTVALLYANTAMKWQFRNSPVRLTPKKGAFFFIPIFRQFFSSKI